MSSETTKDFVVSSAREVACKTIEEAEVIRLSAEDQRRFADAMVNPAPPSDALERAARRRLELFSA